MLEGNVPGEYLDVACELLALLPAGFMGQMKGGARVYCQLGKGFLWQDCRSAALRVGVGAGGYASRYQKEEHHTE